MHKGNIKTSLDIKVSMCDTYAFARKHKKEKYRNYQKICGALIFSLNLTGIYL
jgi:hypothetical protein